MSMKKKQINALMEIMDIGSGADKCLEKTDGSLYQCANNFLGVVYHEEIPPEENWRRKRTPQNEVIPYEPEQLAIQRMIQYELNTGDYTLVTGPFPGEIQVSKLAEQLRANQVPNPNGGSKKVVELTATSVDGSEYVSIFNPRYIRLAVDAVGGKPRLYLGCSNKDVNYKFLIVDSGPGICDMEQNNMAIVMPVRRPG